MSYEEYERQKHEAPSKLVLERGRSKLYYFGEHHSFDPHDPQWPVLASFWQEFLTAAQGQERLAFIEGGIRSLTQGASREEVICEHGGMGLLTLLAQAEGIEVRSPEPSAQEERKALAAHFTRDEIQYYYFIRVVGQWQRYRGVRPDFEAYLSSFLERDARVSAWSGYDFSLRHMRALHRQFFAAELDPHDPVLTNLSGPVRLTTRSNEVARAVNIYRDEHCARTIAGYLEHASAFGNYGVTHVVMQEPLLRHLVQGSEL